MSTQIKKFSPPYLRLDNPTDAQKIRRETNLLAKKSSVQHSVALKQNDLKSLINITTEIPHKEIGISKTVLKKQNLKPTQSSEIQNKTLQLPITVSPAGKVDLGFNCKKEFSATLGNYPGYSFQWYLSFKDSNGFFTAMPQYLGYTTESECSFELDYSTYYLVAYHQLGKATFKIQCGVNGTPALALNSDEVTLDFSQQACVGIHSASLNSYSFKGGNSDTDKSITLTINLDAPAPPGGQKVNLSLSCENDAFPIGRFVAANYFTIPEGQTSEGFNWFLGTRKVRRSNKTFDIIAKVNATESHSTVTLEKE